MASLACAKLWVPSPTLQKHKGWLVIPEERDVSSLWVAMNMGKRTSLEMNFCSPCNCGPCHTACQIWSLRYPLHQEAFPDAHSQTFLYLSVCLLVCNVFFSFTLLSSGKLLFIPQNLHLEVAPGKPPVPRVLHSIFWVELQHCVVLPNVWTLMSVCGV